MTKFRLYFDKDKETIWLNEMAAKGYALKNFFAGFYQFEDCEPGEYTYQIDIDSKFASVTDDYREFMEENKIEIVCLWGYWNILRKKSADGEFILYTDVDSTIEHYTKILTLFKVVTIIEMLCFLLEAFAAFRGQAVGIFGMFLAGLFTFVMMHATFSTKRTILNLIFILIQDLILKIYFGQTATLSDTQFPDTSLVLNMHTLPMEVILYKFSQYYLLIPDNFRTSLLWKMLSYVANLP